MNRDINDGKDLPPDLLRVRLEVVDLGLFTITGPLSLQGYFDAIRQSPFQYHDNADELAEVFFNPDHQGYLTKEG